MARIAVVASVIILMLTVTCFAQDLNSNTTLNEPSKILITQPEDIVPAEIDKRWKLYNFEKYLGAWLYDTKSVTINGNVVKVWSNYYQDTSVITRYNGMCSNYFSGIRDLVNVMFLTEINCDNNTYTEIEYYCYGKFDSEKHIQNEDDSTYMENIKPGSPVERLKKSVCTRSMR